MSARPIIDAGPGLNFLSVNKERLLISVLGPLSAPETVQDEVFRKSAQDSRFRAAATVWRKLSPRWIQILSDDATPELAAVVQRITGSPMDERKRQSKDLGETMVIAHAVVAAESGQSVTVLMDDGPGAHADGSGQTFTDPRLCAAIVDRLTFNAAIIETGTESYRLARARAGTAKAAA